MTPLCLCIWKFHDMDGTKLLAYYTAILCIRPSVPYSLVIWKQKKRRKLKIGVNFPQGTSEWSAIFQMKGQRSSSPDIKNHRKLASCSVVGGRQIRRRLQTRPTPLLGLIYCWHLKMICSATGRTAYMAVVTCFLDLAYILLSSQLFDLLTSLHGLTPPYLSEDCKLVTGLRRRHLRSVDVHTRPRTQTRLGDRSFAVAGPRLWNNLPVELRQWDICLSEFRRDSAPCDFVWVHHVQVHLLTYLLTYLLTKPGI